MLPDNNMPSQQAQTRAVSYDAGLRAFFQRVYNTMSMGLVVTGAVAWFVAHSPALMQFFFGNHMIILIVAFAPLGFIFFGFSRNRIMTMTPAALTGMFYAFSATLGISMATIFMVYSGESIARVFFITAATFAGMSGFGYTTKKDLSGMGSLMMMGAWGLLVALIVNMFFPSNALTFVTSCLGVIIYTGLVGWNTQMLKQTYNASSGSDANAKLAIMGALGLYIDFINIFMFLMRLLGNRR